ncbi:DNA polymerase III subunit alpha [Silvibacterium dinghuense]|uniref:DNA polymerase III subunit alpha n=1 Tax=Silvibacterium dinghuense TaxID=1560006 RepID=A0A4V1NVB9_9BACT|nr:DNA polymerase III subunit alpha [Silvibacterium dinghuense]RXS95230.1 DNA polymerase III subunit alpha [Silvibacterium dinghuense]GGH11676.1 DNA-directed DNA polymerase [Silvibacterium dinghuense]
MAEFTHLHIHTDYSLLDGACDVEKLVNRVADIGQSAVAITDHGNIYGAVHFFEAAKKRGIKPILGCELYVCKKEDHRADPQGDDYNHLLVLAENEEGYRNLVRITSEASLHGFYRKPRISKKYLAEHASGLIGFSGCLSGELSENLLAGNYNAARTTAAQYQDIFGKGNFFLEIQDQGLELEKKIHADLFRIEKELNIPLVATNDSHYLCEDDSHAHEVLLCVQTAGSIHDPKRFKFDSDQFFVKTAAEMEKVFSHAPEVVSRTMQFAERCNLKLSKVDNPFPEFAVPDGHTIDSYFEQVCREGFRKRLDTAVRHLQSRGLLRHPIEAYEARLEREISIIKQMKFPGYFLIVWDFIRYAREHDIPVGPGRGSAAGSLVGYVMEITNIDPLQNELLFERFLNPERVSMPDIDIDFDMNRRGEVIEYVTRKYGREQVAQIITFNTMAAKASIKDVGRALDMPYGDVDRIAKLIPATIGVTIEQALKDSPPLQEAYDGNPQIRELIDTALKLEGLVRGAGVHAAGVVIAPRPLTDLVPLSRSKNDEIVTAYDMKAVEKMGLLKMDFLGLTTLTVIHDCLRLIKKNRDVTLDLETIPLDDQETYEKVYHRALTSGVFQFESGGMRDVLRRYKPTSVEDLTALNALYRPGPIQGGMIDDFIERKWGRRKVEYELPPLETILKETLGVIVYQEQVMQIANVLAGYSLGEADLLRRAMGKKDPAEMAKQRDRFVSGALEKSFPKDKIVRIFDLMEQFAGYGFNKSHSAAYALLAYQTAYLKTHYPVEFMAALLTSEISKPENVVKYIKECREMEIPVEPPDVLFSDADFTPHGNAIRFGLTAIKNVGRNAIDSILAARSELTETGKSFSSYWEFCEKIDLRLINKRVLESLIKAGALDSFGRRSQLIAATDKAIEQAQKSQRDMASGQHGLFGIFDDHPAAAAVDDLPNVADWDENQRLQSEKEVLGFFVSGHPLDKYADKLRNVSGVVDTAAALEMKQSSAPPRRGQPQEPDVAVAGVIVGLKVAKSKRSGELYAAASLEDTVGKIDIICFPKDYARLAESLKIEVPVLIKGNIRAEEDAAPKIAIASIQPLEDVKVKLPLNIRLKVPLERASEATLEELKVLLEAAPGPGKLMLSLEQKGEYCVIMEPAGFAIAADRGFIDRTEALLGRGVVQILD